MENNFFMLKEVDIHVNL